MKPVYADLLSNEGSSSSVVAAVLLPHLWFQASPVRESKRTAVTVGWANPFGSAQDKFFAHADSLHFVIGIGISKYGFLNYVANNG